jgi:predicted transcriptional regulator
VISSHDLHDIPILQELADRVACRIIISTINSAKTVSQIRQVNKLPLSSIYKKVQKLSDADLLSIEKINIDSKGRKVLFYRSRVSSIELDLNSEGILLHLVKNNVVKGNTDTTRYSIKKESISVISKAHTQN